MIGIRRQTVTIAGEGALDYTLIPKSEFIFQEVRLHLSGESTTIEDFVVTLNSIKGSLFNIKLYAKNMNEVQDVIYIPARPQSFNGGDKLNFTWPNTNLKVWGLEIIYDGSD